MTRFFVVKYNKDNAFLQGRAYTGFPEAHCKKLEIPKINFLAVTQSGMGDSFWGKIPLQLWTRKTKRTRRDISIPKGRKKKGVMSPKEVQNLAKQTPRPLKSRD